MKIKRYYATDMRAALIQVRQEQGPDAVILSNRATADGVEVIAATDYDENLVRSTLKAFAPAPARSETAPAPAPEPTRSRDAAASGRTRSTMLPPDTEPATALTGRNLPLGIPAAVLPPLARWVGAGDPGIARTPDRAAERLIRASAEQGARTPAPRPVFASPAQPRIIPSAEATPPLAGDDRNPTAAAMAASETLATMADPAPQRRSSMEDAVMLREMREEMAAMRKMIERELNQIGDERLRGSPARNLAMDMLDSFGCSPAVARQIAQRIPADTPIERGWGKMLSQFAQLVPLSGADPLDEESGVIALVGPTGAGKTTTIAKLAAQYAETHGTRDVAMITTDTARIGGREHLHGYGRQMGIAVHEVNENVSLQDALARVAGYKLVLIDTTGISQRDRALASQLNWLKGAGNVRTLLTIPANMHPADIEDTISRFAPVAPAGVVLTKLDETARLGAALSAIIQRELPLQWITDGQRIPEDLHLASRANLVLRLGQLRRSHEAPAREEEAIHAA